MKLFSLLVIAFIIEGIWLEYMEIIFDSRIMYELSFTNFNAAVPFVWLLVALILVWMLLIVEIKGVLNGGYNPKDRK